MSSDQITYAFCKDSIRYVYQILGDEAFMEEVAFIRRKHLPIVQNTNDEHKNEQIAAENEPESKNVVIQNDRTSYKRSILPSDQVCTFIKKDKQQCTLRKDESSTPEKPLCSRHMK